jgi:integrase
MESHGKSRPYIKGTLAPLSAVFTRAIDDDLVIKNPVLRIMPKRTGLAAQIAKPLTSDQLKHLLETARTKFPTYYPLVLLFARAGPRIGEAVALQVKHVDFEHYCLWVVRNWVKGKIQTPKSGRGRRVDLSDQLASVLREQVKGKSPDDLLFPSKKGTILQPDNFRKRAWTRLFIEAGLPRVRVHDLRHTFASLLLQKGTSLAYVKEQMGHHSISVTVDTYGHLVPGGNRAEVNRLDDVDSGVTGVEAP